VQKFRDRNILVLSKRVEQCNYLFQRLVDEKENVTSLIGKEQEFDRSARILIGTTSKCSTGFDFAKLDTLILACDVKDYFVQVLGRVLRRPEVKPIIFDLVDDNPIIKIHFFDRLKVYKEIGGRIINYNKTN
jgi:superfamily II DNA or RNA helicase